ncbi:MAG: sensor histidine kinase, partial [Kiritimatiellae bacterium]|nr:sensor histidine kinase [Kiritimatiellia bacterium]
AIAGAARRSRRVERLVAERTGELAEANGRLREAMAERLRLEERILRLADDEKARLGRDLHDSLGQKLTGALYLLSAYRRLAEEGIPSLEEDGEVISATLKESLGQVRRMAKGLAPVELTAEGLPDALRALAAESSRLLGVAVEFSDGEHAWAAPAEGVATPLYLIAQEAVVNAAKHGGGRRVRLELGTGGDGRGRLTIDDDGHGMGPAAPKSASGEGGSGLGIMRHRAEVFGGALSVGPSPLGGVRVTCEYPREKPGKSG